MTKPYPHSAPTDHTLSTKPGLRLHMQGNQKKMTEALHMDTYLCMSFRLLVIFGTAELSESGIQRSGTAPHEEHVCACDWPTACL